MRIFSVGSAEARIAVKLSIIIVSYNSMAVLKPCLQSLEKYTPAGETEIIVVDNASSDGSPGVVARDFPKVKLVVNSENVGYSRGVNLGIRGARGEYMLILNPDTVVGDDSIQKLLQFMEKQPDAGIVGPKLIFFDGNIQYSCRQFYTWKVLVLRRTILGKVFKKSSIVDEHLMLDYDHETLREVDWIIGACMLVRRQAVESVGLMDERFFLYFEDVDWCYRMKQKGWKVYYYPDAVITHGYTRDSAQSVLNRSFLAHFTSLVRYYEKWNFLLYFLKKYREVSKTLLFLAVDIFAFNLAFLSAYYLRVSLGEIFPNPIFPIETYRQFIFFENLLFVFTYLALGLYKVRRETAYVDELFSIGKAITLASVLLMTSTYLSQIRTYSRLIVAFLVPFAVAFDWLARTAVRAFHKKLLALKIDLKRICIIGSWENARQLEQKLLLDEKMGFEVVGIVATDRENRINLSGSLGELSQLDEIVDKYRVQELVLLPGTISPERITEIVSMGRRRVLDVTVLTDYSNLVIHQAKVTSMAGRPVIAYHRDTRYALDRLVKRVLDVILGMVFLMVSIPFFVVYFIYTRLKGGKMFLYEKRLGLAKNRIRVPRAGVSPRPSIQPKRSFSDLVNLPLFWMVIKGEMSMVGPYPLLVEDTHLLDESSLFHFDVRPGVTGYWRIGQKIELSLEELLAQDADYIRNWSLVLDFKILLKTIGTILLGRKRTLSIRGKNTQNPV